MNRVEDLEHDGNEWVPAISPLGADPRHCAACHRAWQQERCGHVRVTEHEIESAWTGATSSFRRCHACGAAWVNGVRQ